MTGSDEKSVRRESIREKSRKAVEAIYTGDNHLRALESYRRTNSAEPYDYTRSVDDFEDGLDGMLAIHFRVIDEMSGKSGSQE